MNSSIPETMKAAVIDKFGGPGELHVASIPVPKIGERDILVRIDTAGIGAWDPWIREGGMGGNRFPLVLGSDGSGTVAARGSKVKRFKIGDRIYSYVFSGSKGGFYAEYAAIPEDQAALIPARLSTKEAGALAASGVTALAGLDKLRIRKGATLMILGASGGVGHVALQLAKLQGARVLAVASGADGMELAKRLGADTAVNGRRADVAKAARTFAPDGLDAAMSFAGSEKLQEALKLVKKSGMIAFPNGVEPEPKGAAGVKVKAFDGLPGRDSLERLSGQIAPGPFRVEIGRTYRLEEAVQAHRDIFKHHIGKLAFRVRG